MFWIRYTDEGGQLQEVALALNPTEVDYPDARNFKTQVTQDGAVVLQRPLRDSRTRKWVWRGHRPTVAAYAQLWAILEGLEFRSRLERGLPPTVEIWEDVSGVGGLDRLDGGGARQYTTVTVIQVTRSPRNGGGPVVYDSEFEFFMSNQTHQAF